MDQDILRSQFEAHILGDDIPRVPVEKRELLWRIAWDFGHSSGASEVEYYYRELADLVRP